MKWFRLHSYEWLEGSIRRDLTSSERGIWADLLSIANMSRRRGYIERSKGIPYDLKELSEKFKESEEVVASAIDKCLLEGRLTKNGNGELFITNWKRYQYDTPEGKSLADKRERRRLKREALKEEKEHLQAAAERHELAEKLSEEEE